MSTANQPCGTAPIGRRNGGQQIKVRTKSQNSSGTASGVKSKDEIDKMKKENERKKTDRFEKKL